MKFFVSTVFMIRGPGRSGHCVRVLAEHDNGRAHAIFYGETLHALEGLAEREARALRKALRDRDETAALKLLGELQFSST